MDKIDVKHQGYHLTLEGKYEQALPLLQRALALYRAEIQQGEFALDSYLIDEITIQRYLLRCYFELAGYQGVPFTPEVVAQQESFYQEPLGYLQGAVDSYRIFLRRTLLARTANPIKELTKTAESLQHWQKQLVDQAVVLQQRNALEADPRIARMRALAGILKESCDRMLAARDALVTMEQRVPGKLESFVQSLTSLSDQLEQLREHIVNDMERMKILSADWPVEQQEFVQNLVFLLSLLPLKIEGEHRLIAQEMKNAEERVHSTWDSAFNLSEWLERWRTRLLADEAKIKALNEGQPFFQKLIQFFVDMENGPEALALSERARARAFADLLAERASAQSATEQAVAGYSQAMIDQPITQEEIMQIVQERRSFTIEYFFTEATLIIWTITTTGNITTVVSPVSRSDLELLVNEFARLVQMTEYSEQKNARLFELLQQFYYALIAPIADQIASLSEEEVVTIVPHGQLFLIPYCALLNGQGVYLLEKHALVYAPAVAVLEYTRQNAAHVIHRNEPNLLAFVNPTGNLVSAEQEFDAITRFYATTRRNTVYRRDKARKEVLAQEASNYTVLCFVTHAQAFDERPLDSYLALAPTASDDGRLNVPAIFHLKLHTDLVILGACETGRGKITGDGVNGLSRAFLATGTPTLLMSLWSVGEDESMNQLYLFHEFWREGGNSKAGALRQAQLEALRNHPLQPEVWACFALTGEWS
jgi:CHAT domain-containing protein